MRLQTYVTLVLVDEQNEVLLLRRAEWKAFGAGKYTGVGGHVEGDEVDAIERTVFRELEEESHIAARDVRNLRFRGTILTINRGEDTDHLVYYYTGEIARDRISDLESTEGTLHLVAMPDVRKLDLVYTFRICFRYFFNPQIERFACLYDERDNLARFKLTRVHPG